jgi:pyrimidine operon attenuation protein / uracil phosphoribosyltransferase
MLANVCLPTALVWTWAFLGSKLHSLMSAQEHNRILSSQQTLQKIRRLAYEIYEKNFTQTGLVLAGIEENGFILAQRLQQELQAITKLSIKLISVRLDKLYPTQSEVLLSMPQEELHGQVVVLIDDVLNTGRTLAYSLRPFLSVPIAGLQTAVLVDRNHANYPIAADFVGYRLSTTINEHVEVVLEDTARLGVYLY